MTIASNSRYNHVVLDLDTLSMLKEQMAREGGKEVYKWDFLYTTDVRVVSAAKIRTPYPRLYITICILGKIGRPFLISRHIS